ncbi:hypothetical protein GCM10010126_11620 [Planomonospora parontospora]|uniref:Uncharacterized protein n=1 Tax=Planomonospora parontospora TaxID=58119 RepID=A0AA37F328_9ACTN|nr:hypothetical protein GCM10010126_11620 [Planomonospora parontospora]
MPGPDQSEVSAIERRDLRDIQPLSDGDDRHIRRIKTRVPVEPDEFGHTPHVSRAEIDQLELFRH